MGPAVAAAPPRQLSQRPPAQQLKVDQLAQQIAAAPQLSQQPPAAPPREDGASARAGYIVSGQVAAAAPPRQLSQRPPAQQLRVDQPAQQMAGPRLSQQSPAALPREDGANPHREMEQIAAARRCRSSRVAGGGWGRALRSR